MKVFSKEKFIKRMGRVCSRWVDECDGMPVDKHGGCKGRNGVTYDISDTWVIDVPDAVNCKCVVKTREGQKGEKKMYTMKDFKEKRIAVRVGKEHMAEFLRMCEEEGLRWRHGEKPTAFNPAVERAYIWNGSDHCVTLHCKYGAGHMMWGSRKGYEEDGLTIVDFEEFATQPRYKITIECDGTTTTARMEINGKEVKTAKAKRNPADKFDWRIGAETAFRRLFGKKEEKKPGVFKVGDRVVCVEATDGNRYTVGKHGRVIRVRPEEGKHGHDVSVEFDKDVCGHSCGGNGKWGYCWNCGKETLRHE